MTDEWAAFEYRIDCPAMALLRSEAQFDLLAAAVRRDLEPLTAPGRTLEANVARSLVTNLLFLDILQGRHSDALEKVDRLRSLSNKSSVRLTAHIVAECIALSRGGGREAFRARLEEKMAALPWNVVAGEIKRLRADAEILNETLIQGLVESSCEATISSGGGLGQDLAALIIRMRYYLTALLPVRTDLKEILDRYIHMHRADTESIWPSREIELPRDSESASVVIGIWDSGVDAELFRERMASSGGRYGIAWDLAARPVPDLLLPLTPRQQRDYAGKIELVRGFAETRVGVRSPSAEAFERRLAALPPEQITPFLEELGLFSDYLHGTHIAGIAVEGNPFARLLAVRVTWDHGFTTAASASRDWADAQALAYRKSVDFFREGGARVVNISWNRFPAIYSPRHDADASAREEARGLFEADRESLYRALADADDILFVVAAGNSDDDVVAGNLYPASFRLPNLIVAAAADECGQELAFSNHGAPAMVHANGYKVMSFVPGGERLALSGTSMAAGQVTNLAAKLFSANPSITASQAAAMILQGADAGQADGPRLINPRRTLAKLGASQGIHERSRIASFEKPLAMEGNGERN